MKTLRRRARKQVTPSTVPALTHGHRTASARLGRALFFGVHLLTLVIGADVRRGSSFGLISVEAADGSRLECLSLVPRVRKWARPVPEGVESC